MYWDLRPVQLYKCMGTEDICVTKLVGRIDPSRLERVKALKITSNVHSLLAWLMISAPALSIHTQSKASGANNMSDKTLRTSSGSLPPEISQTVTDIGQHHMADNVPLFH